MNTFSGISWNIRGCNNITNRRNIKAHIQDYKANFICIQETKCSSWDSAKKNTLWDEHSHGWIEAPVIGSSGGLLTTWDTNLYRVDSHTTTKNWILVRGNTIPMGVTFYCVNVYAPQETGEKVIIWEKISNILNSITETPTILMGDFNSVTNQEDRINCAYNILDTRIFNDFIENNGLIYIRTQQPHFTWMGLANKRVK